MTSFLRPHLISAACFSVRLFAALSAVASLLDHRYKHRHTGAELFATTLFRPVVILNRQFERIEFHHVIFHRLSIDSSQLLTAMVNDSQHKADRLVASTPSTDVTPSSTGTTLPSRAKTSTERPAAPLDESDGGEDCQYDQLSQTNHFDEVDAILEELWSGIQAIKQNVSGYIDPDRACYLCEHIPGLVEIYRHCERLLSQIAGDPVAIEKLGEEKIQRWQRRMTTEGWELGQTNHRPGKPVPDSDLPPAVCKWN
jgi:hypothetical protein